MIFKTIDDNDSLSGQRIVSKFTARKIAQEEATKQLEIDIQCLRNYEAECQKGSVSTETFSNTMKGASIEAQKYATNIKEGTGSAQTFAANQRTIQSSMSETSIVSKIAATGLSIFKAALNSLIFFVVIEGIQLLIKGIDNLILTADEAEEKAEALRGNMQSFFDEVQSGQQTISSVSDRFAELSEHVTKTGENIDLTKDEYSEYLDICNQVKTIMPELVTGYTNEGNAIITLKDNVGSLTEAYKENIRAKAAAFITNGDDDGNTIQSFFDDYKIFTEGENGLFAPSAGGLWNNKSTDYEDYYGYDKVHEWLEDVADLSLKDLQNLQKGTTQATYLYALLKENGYELSNITEDNYEAVHDVLDTRLTSLEGEMATRVSNVKMSLQQMLYADRDYWDIDDKEALSAIDSMFSSIDSEFIKQNNLLGQDALQSFESNVVKLFEDKGTQKAMIDIYTPQGDDESIKDYSKRVNDAIEKVQNYTKDKKINIPLDFTDTTDNVEDLQKSYEDTINRFKDSNKIKDFFDTEGINTQEEIDAFNDVTKGITNADEAIKKWTEDKQNSDETPISPTSFEDAWTALDSTDEDAIKTLKKDLLEVAEAGQLSAEKFNELDETEYFKNLGISAEDAVKKINSLVNASTQLSSMSAQISKMSDMLADKKNGTVASASDLAGFDVSVRGLESWDKFEEVMGSSESSMEQCQKAANALATEWVNDGNFLANLTDENKQYYITQLEDMGVKNAEQIVTEALTKKEEELRFEKLLSADASTDLQNATVADILKLQNLGDITEKERAKLAAFTLEKQYCNKNTIVTDADCQNIYTLAKMAGAGTEALNKLAALKQRLSDNPIMSNEMRNNINSAIQGIVNGVTTSAGAKLDIPQVKVNSSGSSSYKSPSSKKSKSKSKTKSDAAEVFDFIEIKLNNLTDKASKAKDKIDDLLTFGQKKNQTKKAIEATTKAITAQEKAYKKYMAYANKAAKTQNSKKTTSSSSSSSSGNAVYDTATDYLGLKYVWGGASLTKGADCSGFTQQIYKKFGVSLPHHAADQAKMGTKITSKKNLQAGDLVFFGSKSNITHVGIYGGDDKFIESPHTGASVRVSKLSSRKDFVSGSHFSKINNATSTSSSSGKNVKKVKGVSSKTLEHYKKLIREGTLDGTGIASIKNENLKNALKDYQTYYEKAKACKDQVASLTEQLKDLYETLANNPIDSASDKIEKLGTKMDILNAKVGNLTFDPTKKISTSDIDSLYKQIIKNYDSQLSASKTAYTDATKSYNSNKSSLTKSLNKTKAKNIGLTQKEFNSIKSNLKSNKSISYNLINKIENDSLREKCIAHNEYLLAKNTATDNYNQAKEDHTSNVRQARKDRFDKVQERYDNKAGLIEQRKNAVSNSLSIAEAKGQLIGEAYYTRQADAVKSDMRLKQEEAEKLAKKLSTIKFGSNEWYEAQEALNGVYESIQQDEQELAEFQKSINELKFDRFDELLNKLGDITDETDFLIDMLDSDNLFDSDTGMITQDGITAIGLTAQNYDTYLAEAQKYKDAIADLDEMYKNGNGTIGYNDYISKLREYQQGMRNSIKSANEAKKSLVAYVKQGLDAQNDALEEAISKKKELLETDKSLKEWNDKLADSNKNIAKLEKQIAALEGDDSEENRKKLQQLKSDLQDAQKDQSDMLYDRSVSDQEDALDKMLENSKKQAEDYLKDTNKVFSDALTYVNANSSQVASNIEKIAKDTGYDISSYIVSAWKDGGSAVGDYASTLSSNVPNITAQLSLIASSWQSICDAADRAAEASANYAETTVNGTQSIGSPNDSGTSSGNDSGSSGSNDADKQQELNKLRKKASDITEWISKHSVSATHKKSYYGALNQYLYDKQHGQVLSEANEVALAKKLGVSVKSDLSGKNDREKIASALKKLIKDASFSTGGVIKDLVKLSGEDGISFLQRGEAVLSKEQTQALLNFKPVIPQIDSIIGNLKNVPVNSASQTSTYNIDNRTIVEGVATDQIVKQMEGVAQKQAENVVRKINQATYAKGVRK